MWGKQKKMFHSRNYIAVYKKGKYVSYSEAEITGSIIENMATALRKAEDWIIAEIANKLYDKNDCNVFSVDI